MLVEDLKHYRFAPRLGLRWQPPPLCVQVAATIRVRYDQGHSIGNCTMPRADAESGGCCRAHSKAAFAAS
jgi:hypothetical protein